MRIAVVVAVMKSGEKGGAEAFYKGLVRGLRRTSHDVDRIEVVIDESTFEAILGSYEECSSLDLDDYDLVISTKAPTYTVHHRNHIAYLLHTIRVFYDMFHQEFGRGTPEQFRQRWQIHALDKRGLHPDHVRKHLAIGHTPYRRLYEVDTFWQQIKFEVLHPPPSLQGFREPRAGEYVFLPGRLHRWKRVDLVVKAFQYVKKDIPLKIAGAGEDHPTLRALAAGDGRIEFLGRVTDAQLLDLYAGALVIPFVPFSEDYGLITIEAFKSKKPVITCIDSGEPTYFVKDHETGFVVRPEPEAIAEKINYLIDHPDHAAEMGEKGFSRVSPIAWDAVVSRILSAIEFPEKRVRKWMKN
ncbi:MAG TPA: glycosyltransferase family 4 protein, partial [Gammaproteobacteria bacterium]|nr:glycosyltransferase family 4 protein [Gammaproteobacteria bacterium]